MRESPVIADKTIQEYRRRSYRWQETSRLRNIRDALNFVSEQDFAFFWPVSSVHLPNLWEAAAGHRPVPNNHDDPGHITWRWKDELIGQRKWYYAKILRRKSTIISLNMVPNFLAITPTAFYGPEDLVYLLRQGRISREEYEIHAVLTEEGTLDTISLWTMVHSRIACSRARFNRALTLLQKQLLIIADGIAQAGRWRYAYEYRLVQDVYPDLIQKGCDIPATNARGTIILSIIHSNGMDYLSNIHKVLQWEKQDVESAISNLLAGKRITRARSEHGLEGYAIPEII